MEERRRPKTCRCGHDRSHDMVVEEAEYTLFGWILLSMFGVTPKPDHIIYRCQICRQSLGTTRDPRVLARRTDPKKAAASIFPVDPPVPVPAPVPVPVPVPASPPAVSSDKEDSKKESTHS